MGAFDGIENLADQAENLAHQHPDQAKAALDKAEDLIDERTGNKYSTQIEQGGQKAEEFLTGQESSQP